ncbi:hypothetical protein Droror1_Dr00006731 [Drosera rotundifolia]
MAPLMYRTLARTIPSPTLFSSRLLTRRHRSVLPQFTELDLESFVSNPAEKQSSTAKMLEEFVHGVMVRRSTPDWIQFVPGASFWVPPGPKAPRGLELVAIGGGKGKGMGLSVEERRCLTSGTGCWPSSEYFIHDSTPHNPAATEAEVPLEPSSEKESEEQPSQPDDANTGV